MRKDCKSLRLEENINMLFKMLSEADRIQPEVNKTEVNVEQEENNLSFLKNFSVCPIFTPIPVSKTKTQLNSIRSPLINCTPFSPNMNHTKGKEVSIETNLASPFEKNLISFSKIDEQQEDDIF